MKNFYLTAVVLFISLVGFTQGIMERHSCKNPVITATAVQYSYNGHNYDWGMSYSADVFNCRWLRVGFVAGPYNATLDNYYVAINYESNNSNNLTYPKTYYYGYAGVNQVPFYARSFVETDDGIFYSDNIYFGSNVVPPTLNTTPISSIGTSSAYSGGNITSDGGTSISARGVIWGYDSSISLSNNVGSTSDGSGSGSFTSYISGLSSGTVYYVKAYATNSAGTGYGEALQFTTQQTVYPPTVTTYSISSISSTSAYSGGDITYSGGGSITEKGVCWNTTGSPNISNSKTNNGTGTSSFTSFISSLSPNTIYYVRAYAKACGVVNGFNVCATGYGQEETFTTVSSAGCNLPSITTNAISSITGNSAISGGNISNDGGCSVTARGLCWSTNPNPTTSDSKTTDGSGVGGFTSNITGLICGTNYFVRAYATSSSGTAYGNTVNFSTDVCTYVPTVSLNAINKYGDTYATFSGAVTGDGNSTVTERGFVYSTSPSPTTSNNKITLGNGIGLYSTNIYGLSQNTRYYVRAYAINSVGTAYSNEVDFTTLNTTVVVNISTAIPSNITVSSATLGGNISSDGGNTITDRGVVYGLSINPTISDTKVQSGSGTGAYSLNVTGLTQGTTYHVRAYAINSSGTFYGADENFITLTDGATACEAGQTFPGGTSYPSTNSVVLGSGTGIVTLTFDALGIPDFFSVEYNSTIYNSGWRGDPIYDYGGSLRASFRSSLIGKVDPSQNTPFPPTFPNTALYPEDGYPRINSVTGQIVFSKTTNNPTSATVKVYAPMSGTKWSYVLSCPN